MSYTITRFSEITGLSPHTLRYYEKEKLLIVLRNSSGRRYYTEADVGWIDFIKKLKETGMPIKDIKKYAALRYEGDGTMTDRLLILEKHHLFVLKEKEKWDNNLDNIEKKIKYYKDRLSD